MAYRRYGRRRYGRRRFRRSRGMDHAGALKYAVQGVRFLKSVLNPELKYFDNNVTAAISNTGVVTPLNQMVQGNDEQQRDGNSIKCHKIVIRTDLARNSAATSSATFVRMLLICDTDGQGSTPATTDILSVADPASLINVLTYPARFKILWDKQFHLDTASATAKTMSHTIYMNKYPDCQHLHYSSSAANSTKKNALFLLQIASEATNTPSQNTYVRLRYYDN